MVCDLRLDLDLDQHKGTIDESLNEDVAARRMQLLGNQTQSGHTIPSFCAVSPLLLCMHSVNMRCARGSTSKRWRGAQG
jgi:hypothetical protein